MTTAAFDIEASIERARERFGTGRSRSDRGGLRLDARIAAFLRKLLMGRERPPMVRLVADLERFCRRDGLQPPARATIYAAMEKIDGHRYAFRDLPAPVRAALKNLDGGAVVPGRQVVFACFQQGGMDAVTFASSLPWLDLYQASRLRGWRPRCLSLLESVMKAR